MRILHDAFGKKLGCKEHSNENPNEAVFRSELHSPYLKWRFQWTEYATLHVHSCSPNLSSVSRMKLSEVSPFHCALST